jgi:hypothetical protein
MFQSEYRYPRTIYSCRIPLLNFAPRWADLKLDLDCYSQRDGVDHYLSHLGIVWESSGHVPIQIRGHALDFLYVFACALYGNDMAVVEPPKGH